MDESNSLDTDVVINDDGQVEFTAEGLEFYRAYFGYAGIDIRRIKNREDLYRASRAAFPYLLQFMGQRLKKRQQTLETRALLAIVESDVASLDRIEAQLRTRQRLHVVSTLRDAPPVPDASP